MTEKIHIRDESVAEARNGSRMAMALIYNQYSKQMFGICMRMLGRKDDAEDVLQEAFITAFTKLGQLDDDRTFGGWLRKIVINNCIQYSKKRLHWEEISPDEEPDNNEEEEWLSHINLETVYEAIKSLPNGYRQVFNLFAVEGFSHKKIAELLGITESTSKSQYHKAKKQLKEQLLKKK
ncbi:MAG: polymerase ECF-type sigma factor [Chitinophagaceae bacterium]|nr:polymerase ECF-type sigma factor [Chitinophagaceae bacterium]